jgi:hypothetical protein
LLLSLPAAALPFSNLYVFGDSIVDAGNLQVVTGGTTPAPGVGYFDGRFTNGINPADSLSLAITGVNSDNSLSGGTSWWGSGSR